MQKLRKFDFMRKAFSDANVSTEFTMYEYESDLTNNYPDLPKDRVNQVLLQQVHIANVDNRYSNTRFINDAAGNLKRYTHDAAYGVDYNYNTADQFDNYQVSTIKADSGGGTTTNTYDVNGHLISVD
ncbi:hypothetical protein ACO0LF_31510, partial [Undibacterium sp. Di27W]|uniref:hypothetical protein n=1 Tax=Undibacterium sp. Di27W TaxID=3413036 RepID=UPI003BF3876B